MPSSYDSHFFTNEDIRNARNLNKPSTWTNYLKYSLRNKGIEIWNELESDIKKDTISCKIQREYKKYIF